MSEYSRRKMKMHEHLGAKCAVCDTEENLHIDHKDPSTKEFCVLSNWAISWERLVAELDKCQLLCADHHLEKSMAEGSLAAGHRYGEDNNFSKLTAQDVREIRAKYATQNYTYSALGAEHGVSRQTVRNIVLRRYWAHVE